MSYVEERPLDSNGFTSRNRRINTGDVNAGVMVDEFYPVFNDSRPSSF